MFFGSLEFAPIFAQFRRDKIEIDSLIKFGFIVHFGNLLHRFFLSRFRTDWNRGKAILVQRPAPLKRATAQLDVVFLVSREVSEREWIFYGAHDPQITLHSGTEPHTRLRRSLRDD